MLQLRSAASCQLHRRLWSRRPGVANVGCNAASATPDTTGTPAPPHATATAASQPLAGLSPHQVQQLRTYLDYMLEVNKSMNLTEAWDRHICDSLVLLPVMDKHLEASLAPAATSKPTMAEAEKKSKSKQKGRASGASGQHAAEPVQEPGHVTADIKAPAAVSSSSSGGSSGNSGQVLRIIDVGTGAGLPGMVLAIARPQWKVTLLDTLRKRCDFLRQAADKAGITNVEVVWARAEEAGHKPELREAYDVAVARAVAETRVLAELCLPLVRVGGLWFAAKGPNPQAEVDAAGVAIKQLGGRLLAVDLVDSFSQDGQRTAVAVSKTGATPVKYPRKPGTPNSNPL